MEPNLPKTLYLLGATRSVATKVQRRANRFKERTFRIGEIVVRPNNRRLDITVEFLAKHIAEILVRVKNGQLIVQHDADHSCDADELRSYAAKLGVSVEDISDTDTGLDEVVEVSAEAAQEPAQAVAAVLEPAEPVEAAAEPAELPAEPAEDVEITVEPEAELRWLPDNFESMTKRELLALCADRGITIDTTTKPSNDTIINKLTAWRLG